MGSLPSFLAAACFPGISAATSVMIGDSLVDMEFGGRLGMATILVEGSPANRAPDHSAAAGLAGLRCASLSEAVNLILDRS